LCYQLCVASERKLAVCSCGHDLCTWHFVLEGAFRGMLVSHQCGFGVGGLGCHANRRCSNA
jgi:hypothetical protein